MARGAPNRGRGRGGAPPGGNNNIGNHRGTSARGRGRGGRGRGGASTNPQDFTGVSLDYDALSEQALGFNPAPSTPIPKAVFKPYVPSYTPNLYSAYPPTPPGGSQTPSTSNGGSSGYASPKGGLGAPARGGHAGRGGRGRGFKGGYDSPRGGGRGGMIGGLGFHAGSPASTRGGAGGSSRGGGVVGLGGGFRPLLVPVKFVKASGLTPTLSGDDEKKDKSLIVTKEYQPAANVPREEQEATPGELEDKIMSGALVEVVRELEDLEVDPEEPAILIEDEEAMDVEPTPSATDDEPASSFVLGTDQSTAQPLESEEDSSDEEQIVFAPSNALARSISAPKAPTAPVEEPSPLFVVDTQPSPIVFAPTEPTPPPTKPAPPPKLSKSQKAQLKKAGKKARKNGKVHARSGNQHRVFQGDDSDVEEVDEAMFERLGIEDMVEGEGEEDDEEETAPRVGDSDLEWGSGGPDEVVMGERGAGKAKKAARKAQRDEQREKDKLARMSMGARAKVAKSLGNNSMRERKKRELLAQEDYEKNVLGISSSDEEGEGGEEGEEGFDLQLAAQSFAAGLLGGTEGNVQMRVDELDEEDSEELEGWRTTSGSESDEESDEEADSDDMLEADITLGEADAAVELAMAAEHGTASSDFNSSIDSAEEDAAVERALLAGETIRMSSLGASGKGGRRDRKEKKRAKKGKGKMIEYSSTDSEDDDDGGMFRGEGTWADDDEDYIRGVQRIIEANADLLEGRDRKSRKKLFKAIQDGDFEDVDFDEFEEEDFIMSTSRGGGANKGKGKAKNKATFSGEFDDDLQSQWAKDRSKKAEYKRERALARAEQVEQTGRSKKGARPPASFVGSSDAATLNSKMRDFILYEVSERTMALPPMSKKSRVAVHLLAEVYSLKSKSMGSGKARFPVLEKTSKSTTWGVDERKIRAILGTASGEEQGRFWKGVGQAKGKQGGLWAALSGDVKKGGGGGGGGGGGKKNSEGAVVGQGADRIGEDNIGFALLKRMGWTEGTQIGVSGGIHEPIAARVKNSKSGLGSGYSVTRSEAQKMAVAGDGW